MENEKIIEIGKLKVVEINHKSTFKTKYEKEEILSNPH